MPGQPRPQRRRLRQGDGQALELGPGDGEGGVVGAVDDSEGIDVGPVGDGPGVPVRRAAGCDLAGPGHRVEGEGFAERDPQPVLVEGAGDPDLELDAPRRGLGVEQVDGLVDGGERHRVVGCWVDRHWVGWRRPGRGLGLADGCGLGLALGVAVVDPNDLAVEVAALVAVHAAQAAREVARQAGEVVGQHPGQGVGRRLLVRAHGRQRRDPVDMGRDAGAVDDDVEAVGGGDLAEGDLPPMEDPAQRGVALEAVARIEGPDETQGVVGDEGVVAAHGVSLV